MKQSEYFRSGCTCKRVGICFRCHAADEMERFEAEIEHLSEAIKSALQSLKFHRYSERLQVPIATLESALVLDRHAQKEQK